MDEITTPPQALDAIAAALPDVVIADPPLAIEPAAGTGALPRVELIVKRHNPEDSISRPAAVALLLQMMRRPGLTVDESDALAMAVSHITRKCRQVARWRIRKAERIAAQAEEQKGGEA